MKNYIQKYICKSVTLFVGTSFDVDRMFGKVFLDPDPQTMFEPETVFFYGKWYQIRIGYL